MADIFEDKLARLNKEQKKAVTHNGGPLLVVAGPGTGKTQTLSLRVAYMIRKLEVNPKSILCLTFTNAGVDEMRKRIYDLVGGAGDEVAVHTFHSFAGAVTKNHEEFFSDFFSDSDFLEDNEKASIIQELIDELEEDNPIIKGIYDNKYSRTLSFLANSFTQIFKERPDFLGKEARYSIKNIERYLHDLENNIPEDFRYKINTKTAKVGDIKTASLAKERRAMSKTLATLQLYDRYQNLLREKKRYTYDNIIEEVMDVLKKGRKTRDATLSLGLLLEEQFEYILVDEFQDTNGTQYYFIESLTSYWKKEANIFIVGDKNQMIYRFQGAEESNLRKFKRTYQPKEITLIENYRSTQEILDAARSILIAQKKTPKDIPRLLAKGNYPSGPFPKVYKFTEQEDEYWFVIQSIIKLYEEGVALKEIAVLYRTHKIGKRMLPFFHQYAIPYTIKHTENAFTHPLIQYIVQVWKYVVVEKNRPFSNGDAILPILYGLMNDYKAHDIAQCYQAYRKEKMKRQQEETYYLRTFFVENKTWSKRFPIMSILENMIGELSNQPLNSVFTYIITKLEVKEFIQYSPYFTKTSERLQALMYVQSLAEDYRMWADENISTTSEEYLDKKVNLYESNEIVLPLLYPHLYEETDEDKVILSTLHAAKGKEYEYVFMIGNTKSEWEQKGNNNQFKIPKLLKDSSQNKKVEENAEEEERISLFYVGMTRAKRALVLTYTGTKEGLPCLPLNLLINYKNERGEKIYPVQEYCPTKEDKEIFVQASQSLIKVNTKNGGWERPYLPAIKIHFGQEFHLSYSSLSNYEYCPFSFYMSRIFQVPISEEKVVDARTIGSDLHKIIEHVWDANLTKEVPPPYLSFTPEMEKNLCPLIDTSVHLEKYMNDLYQTYLQAIMKTEHLSEFVLIEKQLKTNINNMPCKLIGKLDHLCLLPEHKQIIDFKRVSFLDLDKNTKDKWKDQALFYKILIDEMAERDPKYKGVERAVFLYIIPEGQIQKHTICFNELKKEKIALLDRIKAVWEDIQSWGIDKGKEFIQCDNNNCHYCSILLQKNRFL